MPQSVLIGMAEEGWIDFDGDYGGDYDHLIRIVIAGYGLMHELGVAAARAACPQARELLLVGPAYPNAQFTLGLATPQPQLLHTAESSIGMPQSGREASQGLSVPRKRGGCQALRQWGAAPPG